jgi:hypothetical protein
MSEGATIMARLGLDIKSFKSELQNASSAASKFSTNLGAGVGALAAGLSALGLGSEIKSAVEYGSKIEDLSARYGVATDALQKFGNAAELGGSSLEAVAKGFGFLEKNQAKALGGNEAILQSFNALGITLNDLKSMRPEDIMLKIGKSSLNAADVVKVLGKSALELRPILAGLADGTTEFGSAISEIEIRKLKEADDAIKRLNQSIKILSGALVADAFSGFEILGDILENVFAKGARSADGLIGAIQKVGEAYRDNGVVGAALAAPGAYKELADARKDNAERQARFSKAQQDKLSEKGRKRGRDLGDASGITDTGAGDSDDDGRQLGSSRGRGRGSSSDDDTPLRDTWGAKWAAGGHPGRLADVGESQSLVDEIEKNRIAAEAAQRPGAQPLVETGSGGPSLMGAAAEAARKAGLDKTRESSRAAQLDRESQVKSGIGGLKEKSGQELIQAATELKNAAVELKKSLTNQ